jgi:hypothetical protein
MNVLFGELVKEPMVYSHFMVSEEGRPYVELVFNVFAPSLARRFEVSHTLNMAIQQRFKGTGIRVQDIAP